MSKEGQCDIFTYVTMKVSKRIKVFIHGQLKLSPVLECNQLDQLQVSQPQLGNSVFFTSEKNPSRKMWQN